MSKIKTTGQLREFLCSSINSVANGTLDVQKASHITKLAGQVNESIYAEARIAKMQIDLGRAADEFGGLSLHGKIEEE
jgi:hypothetical protein